MEKTVLITGACGFIGSHLGHQFQQMGWSVIGISRSDLLPSIGEFVAPCLDRIFIGALTDEALLKCIFDQFDFDLCIHLAGPADVNRSFEQPATDFREHTLPLLSLLDAQRRVQSRVKTLVVSSAAVYGNPIRLPVSESDPLSPISPYGFGKYHQELLARQYCELHHIPTCCARVFSTFGPGLRRLAVWEITRRAMGGVPLVFGAGDETRDFLYVADVAKALAHLGMRADFNGDVYNIASGVETSIRDLAKQIFKTVDLSAEPQFSLREETGKPKRWRANVEKLTALGFSPDFSLESGLDQTVAWVRENA